MVIARYATIRRMRVRGRRGRSAGKRRGSCQRVASARSPQGSHIRPSNRGQTLSKGQTLTRGQTIPCGLANPPLRLPGPTALLSRRVGPAIHALVLDPQLRTTTCLQSPARYCHAFTPTLPPLPKVCEVPSSACLVLAFLNQAPCHARTNQACLNQFCLASTALFNQAVPLLNQALLAHSNQALLRRICASVRFSWRVCWYTVA